MPATSPRRESAPGRMRMADLLSQNGGILDKRRVGMIEVRVEANHLQATLLQRIAISGMLGQDLREVWLAQVNRGQTMREVLPGQFGQWRVETTSSPLG